MSDLKGRIRIEDEILSTLGKRFSEEEQANHLMSLLMDNYPLLSATVLAVDEGGSPTVFAHRGLSGNFIKGLYAGRTPKLIESGIVGEIVLPGGDPRLTDPAWRFEHEAKSLYAAPCRLQGETLGVLLADSGDPALFDADTRAAFLAWSNLSAIYLALRAYHHKLSRVPDVDSVTGLHNFKFFHEALHQELTRGKKFHYPVSLMFIKVRHLREMNEVYGHVAADKALVELARVVKAELREVDYVARSGSMIYIVMPKMSKEEAGVVAEKVLAAMNASPLGRWEVMLKTAIGVASYPKDGDSERVLFPHVEAMVQESSRKGDNAVSVF
ncbi:MAG: GGDEF domain-containing protein [Deltaproteobacteria bacterium]|nr:MAG: GGDEF domain-containing protein [Deltaproteobacteria bacterium]